MNRPTDEYPPLPLPLPDSDKPTLRRRARARRATLDMSALSEMLVRRLRQLPVFQSARHVLLYRAMPGEVDINALTDAESTTNAAEKTWYVPRCAPGRRLTVHRYVTGDPLRQSRFGVWEPDPKFSPEIDPTFLDLVIVPALLLTPGGDRLGYGGGYYDRFLPHLAPRCVTIGLLPDALIVPSLPKENWDIPLDFVVSERVS